MRRTRIAVAALSLATLAGAPIQAVARGPARSAWKAAPEGTFKLTRFVLTRRLEHRQPADSVDSAPCDGERVYAFVELFNKGPGQRVVMTWKRDGNRAASYRLAVGRSPSWKTWSYQRSTGFMKGRWTITLHDEAGTLLGQKRLAICQ